MVKSKIRDENNDDNDGDDGHDETMVIICFLLFAASEDN